MSAGDASNIVNYRLRELEADLNDLKPMKEKYVELAAAFNNLSERFSDMAKKLEKREAQTESDRKSLRNALIGLTGVIGAAIIGAIGLVASSGVHP